MNILTHIGLGFIINIRVYTDTIQHIGLGFIIHIRVYTNTIQLQAISFQANSNPDSHLQKSMHSRIHTPLDQSQKVFEQA